MGQTMFTGPSISSGPGLHARPGPREVRALARDLVPGLDRGLAPALDPAPAVRVLALDLEDSALVPEGPLAADLPPVPGPEGPLGAAGPLRARVQGVPSAADAPLAVADVLEVLLAEDAPAAPLAEGVPAALLAEGVPAAAVAAGGAEQAEAQL